MLVGGNMRVCRVKLMCGGFGDVECRFRDDVRLLFGYLSVGEHIRKDIGAGANVIFIGT
jgi:hypothetical protein